MTLFIVIFTESQVPNPPYPQGMPITSNKKLDEFYNILTVSNRKSYFRHNAFEAELKLPKIGTTTVKC